MAFRINTALPSQEKNLKQPSQPEKIYTEEEILRISSEYEKNMSLEKNLISDYKKNLVKEPAFDPTTIIYDRDTKKWKISKEPQN